MKKMRKILIYFTLSLAGLCLLLAAVSAISNLSLPDESQTVEVLEQADKIRLAELRHLVRSAGDIVWPGFGETEFAMVVYNESYAFVAGCPDPADGWIKVPADLRRGGPWEVTPGDTFYGEPYYRQVLRGGVTPEAFTVRVGDCWACSLQTLPWMQINLVRYLRQDLPPVLEPIFPYRLFASQAIDGSDAYIAALAHEAFHAFQGMSVPQKFASAEQFGEENRQGYPWTDAALEKDWQTELDLLSAAMGAAGKEEAAQAAQQFLEQRSARRKHAGLNQNQVDFEQQREWLEGLAHYVEVEIYRQGSLESYVPLPETGNLEDFDGYQEFEKRWSREVDQVRRMASDTGSGRFYYSGMAQAYLLDRLSPGWKERGFTDGVWLEDLLAQAVQAE